MRSLPFLAAIVIAGAMAAPSPSAAQRGADIPAIEKRMRDFQAAGNQPAAFAEARRLEAAVKARFGSGHPNYAIVLNNLGAISEDQGKFDAAEGFYRRALALLQGLPKQRGQEEAAFVATEIAGTLNNLAIVHKDRGRYGDEEAAHRQELAVLELAFGPDSGRVAATLGKLATTLRTQNKLGEARALLERALRIQEPAAASGKPEFRTQLADTLNILGTVLQMQGDRQQAEALMERSLKIREEMPGLGLSGVASTLVNLAALYDGQGRRAEAASLLQRALTINEKIYGTNHPNVAVVLNNLGILQENQGLHEQAEGLQKRALAIREAVYGPAHPTVAQSLTNLSVVYRAQGRHDEAADSIERAIAIWQKSVGPNHPVVAGSLENLAIARQAQGRLPEAEQALKKALAIQEAVLGPDHTDLSGTLNNLANVYDAEQRYRDAEDVLERALAIQTRALGPNHPDLIPTLNNLATAYRFGGKKQKALDASRRATDSILAQVAVAEAGAQDGGVELARRYADYFGRHLADVAAVQRETGEASLSREAFRIAQWTGRSAAAGALRKTNARVAAGNDELAGLVRDNQDLAAAVQQKDKALIAAVSQPGSGQARAAMSTLREEAAGLRARLAANEAVLDQSFPAFAALAHPKPLESAEVQKLLGEDEALAVMVVGEAGTFVFAISRDDFAWQGIRLGSADFAARVSAFRRGLDVEELKRSIAAGKPELFDLGGAYDLYTTLFGPIERVTKDKKHLMVVASGPLTSLPFHLLVTEPPGEDRPKDLAAYAKAAWLAKRQAVSVLPSVDGLASLRALPHREASAKPLIGFADPVFSQGAPVAENPKDPKTAAWASKNPSRGYGDFWQGAGVDRERLAEALPALPETADELKAVAAKLDAPASDLYLGAAATETAVKHARLSDYRVVYFATHGLVAGDVKGIGEPSLALSLPTTPSAEDDGLLTASEVSQLKLGADWVVLSACNTAAGETPGAEALSGLARAFFYAGSRALLVSHWAVASDSATRLTTATFDLLAAHPDLGRAEALRQAMLGYMNDGANPQNAYPAFWGPFSVVGEGGR